MASDTFKLDDVIQNGQRHIEDKSITESRVVKFEKVNLLEAILTKAF